MLWGPICAGPARSAVPARRGPIRGGAALLRRADEHRRTGLGPAPHTGSRDPRSQPAGSGPAIDTRPNGPRPSTALPSVFAGWGGRGGLREGRSPPHPAAQAVFRPSTGHHLQAGPVMPTPGWRGWPGCGSAGAKWARSGHRWAKRVTER